MKLVSQTAILPSASKPTLNPTAPAKNMTSRTNDFRETLNGRTMAIEPDTTDVMKNAAPMSSPIARLPDPTFMAADVAKRTGEPLPNARNGTQAIDSDLQRVLER